MKFLLLFFLVFILALPVSAVEIEAPAVPESGERLMPEAETFGEGLMMILKDLIPLIRPDLREASKVCIAIIATVIVSSVIQGTAESIKTTTNIAAVAGISVAVLTSTGSLIHLASDTVTEMSEYGKLLFPVLTAALAAQGAIGTSAALFAATTAVNSIISGVISGLLIPVVYMYLAIGIAAAATGEGMLKKTRDLLKSAVSWCLKSILTVFTTYMTITGVVSGTTDAAALKATKAAISSVVPVVGGILSNASEAVLVSASLAKNAAGVYGILALLSIFLEPFLLISCHYIMLKVTGAICGIFGSSNISELAGDLSGAMGLLLAMTGAVCILFLVSSVCFLKGVS